MAPRKSRQARENVTEIKPLVGDAANENSAQDGFAPADTSSQPELEHAAATDAAEQILGANPLLGIELHADFEIARHLRRCFAADAPMRKPRLRAQSAVPKPRP